MSEVTKILNAIDANDPEVAARLLPIVYEELRQIARGHMARERSNHTLQPTALVHEAFLRLSGNAGLQWDSRGRFFAAASKAMRRILIDHARHKQAERRGGLLAQVPLDEEMPEIAHHFGTSEEILDLSDALDRFAAEDPAKAQLVELVYFAGLSLDEAAQCLGISRATANRHWVYSRAWLRDAMRGKSLPEPSESSMDVP
jgi:RNA polymerase sigma factor (TIGR02999 family)